VRAKFIALLALSAVLYSISSYYIGLRIYQSFAGWVGDHSVWYWISFAVLSGLYFFGRIGSVLCPGDGSDRLIWLGSYWLATAFYVLILWLAFDTVVIVGRILGLLSPEAGPYCISAGVSTLGAALSTVAYGAWQARIPRISRYSITINKRAAHLATIKVVMISDLHLGLLVGKKRLEQAVEIVASLQPDLVLLPGDILDENIGAFVENDMPEVFRKLQPGLGVYGVLGSHEYVWGHAEKALSILKQAGITILRDNWVMIADSFYLLGRDDAFREQIVGTPRKSLAAIMRGCDRLRPLIVMDHQPGNLEDGISQAIDLQLSGHTHHGQFFPINLLTPLLFPVDWGYLRRGNFQILVSSGYGTWGPPIRTGTISEIVSMTIKFEDTPVCQELAARDTLGKTGGQCCRWDKPL
jgi:uncharacterized protein